MTASGAEGQAVADRSCWTEDLKTCSISAKTATSSQVRFTFMLRQADESLCMDSCASSSTVVASLDEIAGAEEPETCSTGYCIFTWSSPAGQKAGFHTLLAVVGSNSTNTTLLFSPGLSFLYQQILDVSRDWSCACTSMDAILSNTRERMLQKTRCMTEAGKRCLLHILGKR